MDPQGWDELTKEIIETVGVPMMQAVSDRCNLDLVTSAMKKGTVRGKAKTDANARAQHIIDLGKGFQVGVEGDTEQQLKMHNWRATVITASAAAMGHNAKNQTLLRNFPMAALGNGGAA